jgi:indole-3-glycerol phosphate synthase
LEPDEIRKVVAMTQRWKMTSIVQIGTEEEMIFANQLFPHVIAVGNHETQSVMESLALLEQIAPLRQYNTRIMLMNCLTSFEEIEIALSHNIHALIINEDVAQNKEQIQHLHQLIQKKS